MSSVQAAADVAAADPDDVDELGAPVAGATQAAPDLCR